MNVNALMDHLRDFQNFVDKWKKQAELIIGEDAPTGSVGISCDDSVHLHGLKTTEIVKYGIWRAKDKSVVVEVVFHDPVNDLIHLNTGSGMEKVPKIEIIGHSLFLRLFDYVDVYSRQYK